MHHPRRVTPSLLGALVAACLTFGVTGCTSEPEAESAPPAQQQAETDASPMPSESATTAADPRQAAIDQRTADAIERYKEYSQLQNTSYQQGKSAYPKLSTSGYLGSHELREHEEDFGTELENREYKQTGTITVDSFEFIKYDGDPLAKDFKGHKISLTSCADFSQVDYVDGDGASHFSEDQARHVLMNVIMRGIEVTTNGSPSTVWAVEQDQRTEKEC